MRKDINEQELQALDAAGVRGVQLNFVKRLVDRLPRDDLKVIADEVAPLGWHVVIYFEAEDLEDIHDLVTGLPTIVVVDHMGRPEVGCSVDGPEFQQFVALMEESPNFWTKVSCPERLSNLGPPDYEDVIPFCCYLVERFPDRVLWGTDWPHSNMKSHMPDDGALVDLIPRMAPTPELQHSLLVDSPMRLFWPEEARQN